MNGLENAPIQGLEPKVKLLSRVSRLYVEYLSRPRPVEDITEEEVVQYALREKPGLGHTAQSLREAISMLKEAEDLVVAWGAIEKSNLAFPMLSTLSLGAIRGVHGKEPWPDSELSLRWGQVTGANIRAVTRFVKRTQTIRHFCQSGSGPLNIAGTKHRPNVLQPLTISTHSSTHYPHFSPPGFGIPTNWIIHTFEEIFENVYDADEYIFNKVSNAMDGNFDKRRDMVEDERKEGIEDCTQWNMNGELIVGTPYHKGDPGRDENIARWSDLIKDMNHNLAEELVEGASGLPNGVEMKDAWVVKPVWEGSCAACSWDGKEASKAQGWLQSLHAWQEEMNRGAPKRKSEYLLQIER